MGRKPALVMILCAAGAAHAASESGREDVALDTTAGGWLSGNRARLNHLMRSVGRLSGGFHRSPPPVAVFDWDNTVMRNDVGDAMVYWMLRHDGVRQPPGRNWLRVNPNLTPAALAALNAGCDGAGKPGDALKTSNNTACADAILTVYGNQHPPGRSAAWFPPDTPTMHHPYAFGAQLLRDLSVETIEGYARQALDDGLRAPIGATQEVGSRKDLPAWLRIYPQMADLISKLLGQGFDVWIVSASAQPLVEAAAARVGIAKDHVVGVRAGIGKGRWTASLEACGTLPAGDVMTFDEGKRCWINKEVFHLPVAQQLQAAAQAQHRPAFVAGDSDTDAAMLRDARILKLVINRNKPVVMCLAERNFESRWLIQPMFLEPLPHRTEGYPCSTQKDARGNPILDEAGQPIVDQRDSFFGLPSP
jgi:phosphoserine phosphatase